MLIGLTGGIGAGKTTAALIFQSLGAVVISADEISKQVIHKGTDGYNQVLRTFGYEICDSSGEIVRSRLAKLIFSSEEYKKKLEQIIHPLVEEQTRLLINSYDSHDIIVHDIPLLMEKGIAGEYPLVIAMTAPKEVRIQRLVADRGLTEIDVRQRMAYQVSDIRRTELASLELKGDESFELLEERISNIWHTFILPYARNVMEQEPSLPNYPLQTTQRTVSISQELYRIQNRLLQVLELPTGKVNIVGPMAASKISNDGTLELVVASGSQVQRGLFSQQLQQAGFPLLLPRSSSQIQHGLWGQSSKMLFPEKHFLTHGGCDPRFQIRVYIHLDVNYVSQVNSFWNWLSLSANDLENFNQSFGTLAISSASDSEQRAAKCLPPALARFKHQRRQHPHQDQASGV